MPPALLDMPELTECQGYLWEAWELLSRGRPYGLGGPLPLPTVEVAAFLSIHPICEPLRFLRIVRELDALFMALSYPDE